MNTGGLITMYEAAVRLGVSVPTIYRYAGQGIVPTVKIAKTRFAIADRLPTLTVVNSRTVLISFPDGFEDTEEVLAHNPQLRLMEESKAHS